MAEQVLALTLKTEWHGEAQGLDGAMMRSGVRWTAMPRDVPLGEAQVILL